MFIQMMKGSCTQGDEARAMLDRWQTEVRPGAVGWLGGTFGLTADGTLCAVVRFESAEAASANAARPEQGAWWAEMEKLYDGPVTFRDCDDVSVLLDGGSDSAGFVQIMEGTVADATGMRSLLSPDGQAALHAARPEIIGGTLAIAADATFVQTVAFTDQAAARKGETTEMPDDVRATLERSMSDVTFLDLPDPWFASAS